MLPGSGNFCSPVTIMPESSPGGFYLVDHHVLIQMSINLTFVLKANLPH